MIINYGAFVSPTLDKNYLPLTLKYLELYALTYGLDDILGELSKNTNKDFVKAGKGRSLKLESDSSEQKEIIEIDSLEILNGDILSEATDTRAPNRRNPTKPSGGNAMSKAGTSSGGRTTPPSGGFIDNGKDVRQTKPNQKTDTGQLDRGIVSIEPTWIKVTYGDNVFVFGVKVLPVYIKSDTEILKKLVNDSKNSTVSLLTKGLARSFKRLGHTVYNSTIGKLPLLGSNPPTGVHVTKQVIYATSTMKKNIYLVLNKNNISPSFLEDSSSLSDMQKYLGWCSLVFADDVNQQVSFCMKINHGMCNIVPYRVLMQSASKTMSGAYDSIDEIQNAVTSVFRMKKMKVTKILGEMKVATSLLNLQQYLSENILLEAGNSKYLTDPNLAIDMFKKLRFIAKNSDIEDIRKKLVSYQTESVKSIMPFISQNSKNFDKLFKFTQKVLRNSLTEELSDTDIEIASIILAYRNSNMRGVNQFQRLKQAIKEYIYTFRKNIKQIENKKIALFRTTVEIFNSNTAILKYNDLGDDKERQEIILRNLYVFLSLAPMIIIEGE